MQTIFPNAFGTAAMDSYMESQESYQSLFEDKAKYDAIMNALAGVIYREMREPVKKKQSIRCPERIKMKELNLKEKIQNLISEHQKNGCPEGEFGYRDLTPESDTKNSEEYIRALHWAIKNKEVKNIALSGPYGSGKSSVIKTYLEKYPKTKYLSISLAAFSTPTKSVNGEDDKTSSLADDWTLDDVDENVIEEGILKQLFYRVDVGKIPQSRYRKIKKLSYWKMFFSLLMLTVVASVVYFEINPNVLEDFKNTVINNGAFFHLNQWSSYAVFIVTIFVVLLLITTVLKYVMSNFRIANINLGDKASISKKEEKESIFDKSLDEIVYFFESTTYDTVFIEDLDRFNQPNIFIKLRELNTVINNYDNIKRKVVFIYAIKDDMFKDEERTKFFDFIVPVIPYINATNSGEILRGLLKFEKGADGVYKSKNYDISDRYIWKISPFVQDMRVLTNICNEFLVYKRTLKTTKLKDEEMFSMITFKNLYPKEFAELQAERGIVKQAFQEKEKFVINEKQKLEEQIVPKREILENVHSDILFSLQEIKHAFLGFLSYDNGTYYPLKNLQINNRSQYSYGEILKEDFDLTKFDNINQLIIGYDVSNGYYEQSHTVSNVKQKMASEGSKYLKRMNDLKFSEKSKKQELISEIQNLEEKIAKIDGYSLKELIDEFGEDFLPEGISKYGILKFLLINGYINEGYVDYINYFHPNSITKDENDYLRSIRMRNKAKNFAFEIKNLQQVSDRIYDAEYRQTETLNYILTDFMLIQCSEKTNKKYYFDGFELDKGMEHYQFTKEYIERDQNVNDFVSELCKYYRHMWKNIAEDVSLLDETKYKYLSLILNNATMDQIVILDEVEHSDCIKNFIVEDEKSLAYLNGVSADVLIELISRQSIIFREINNVGADAKVLNYIYQNDMYELNNSMISSVIKFYHPNLADGIGNAHYTTILNADVNVLNNRIWNDFEDYINRFVLGIDENVSEDINAVEDIIERLANTNIELAIAVLDKEKVSWDDLDECCENNVEKDKKKEIWNYLLDNRRISYTWKNFESYYNEFGITIELSGWFNQNCGDIVKSEKTDKINNECIKNIIINSEITVQTAEQVADNYKCDEEIEFDVSKLPEDKINLLIRKHYIRYSVSKTEKIRNHARDSFGAYCKEYIDDFVNDLPSISLTESEIVMLLNDTTIDKKYKPEILKKISASSMTEKLAKTIANNQFNADKVYVECAWKILDNAGRHMLLVHHLQVYSIAEISRLLTELGGEWSKLSDNKSRHKEEISIDVNGHNEKLLSQLQRKGFITSHPVKKVREKSFFEVWVKQQ